MLTRERALVPWPGWLRRTFVLSGCLFVIAAVLFLNTWVPRRITDYTAARLEPYFLQASAVPSGLAVSKASPKLDLELPWWGHTPPLPVISPLVATAIILLVILRIFETLRKGIGGRAVPECLAYAMAGLLAIAFLPDSPLLPSRHTEAGAIGVAAIPVLFAVAAIILTLRQGISSRTIAQSGAYLLVGFLALSLISLRGLLFLGSHGWIGSLAEGIAILLVIQSIITTLRQGRNWQSIAQSVAYGFVGLLIIYTLLLPSLQVFQFETRIAQASVATSLGALTVRPSSETELLEIELLSDIRTDKGSNDTTPQPNVVVYATAITALITAVSGLYGQILTSRKMKLDYELALAQAKLNAQSNQPASRDAPQAAPRGGAAISENRKRVKARVASTPRTRRKSSAK